MNVLPQADEPYGVRVLLDKYNLRPRKRLGQHFLVITSYSIHYTKLYELVSGPVTLTADLGGRSGDFSEFARTAEGSGSFRVSGGTIQGTDLLGTAVGLAGLSNLLPTSVAGGGGERRKETPFRELAADFRVGGGKISYNFV